MSAHHSTIGFAGTILGLGRIFKRNTYYTSIPHQNASDAP